jgi:hypothetical protein
MAIEDAIIKNGVQVGFGTVAGAVRAAQGAASAPHVGKFVGNQAAKAGFAGMNSFRHGHKFIPAIGAGAVAVAGPAVVAAVAAAPVILGVAAVGAVGAAAYGVFKFFKD